MLIRLPRPSDLAGILAFWNPLIRNSSVTFSSEERDLAGLARMIADRQSAGRAFLIAEIDGTVAGFASYDQFRRGNGYAHAMEHTIILAEAARGLGLGRKLMAEIEDHARTAGAHVMVAAVSGENRAGQAFHHAIGYRQVGRLPQAGRKFGRWMDLVLLQKLL